MNSQAETLAPRNILEAIRMMRPELRKSDRKVADIVLADPQRILNATVAETAEIAEVSQPTVIRFCTAIGCDGFQDFKIRLAQSLVLGTPATQSAIANDDTPDEVAAKIFDYTMTSLDWARHKLDMAQVNEAVALILSARSLQIFGFGASAIVAQDFQQKFPLLGLPCNATMDSHQQLMAASMMQPGDVAVAISNTGETLSIVELARLAREQGAKVIAISGSNQTALANYSDVLINVETLENTDLFTPTTSRIAALVAVDIISTLVARRLDRVESQRLVRMKRYLSQMRKNEMF
ncbi:MurR/RpiR family transcriptional regulator [Paracoccus lutimaris]|uniref:RpiR family transcriptional regulator n=1 Tax=Paracoccus lutimaris TaxID=1490030 RepID=A0A368Z451_9RHOB|nr:MurR/RpiR family transcriptional regulator [Paracoccus lutimaris]RCW87233.1 RpiR family transcriptional regulator [Paracoccus lutimaris]